MEPEIIVGMDEAGRGSWAGPVVAAAVLLPVRTRLKGLRDSKLLTPSARDRLFEKIILLCPYGIGTASELEIDQFGLLHATFLAFKRAFDSLPIKVDKILIDGRDKFSFPVPHESIIRGDQKIRSISAASILAKVTRDRIMIEYARTYPHYDFQVHKGYGTAGHQKALHEHGPCVIHRHSFAPIISLKCVQESFL